MNYFQQFDQILYTFDPNLYDYKAVVDIFSRVDIIPAVFQNSLIYYPYSVKDSDDATIIAFKYYGDSFRHWIVYFANQVIDPYFDMPLKEADLENNIILAYGSLANAQANLYQVLQYVNVTTSFGGTSNTISYVSTLEDNYSYNFSTNQLEPVTLPSINFPVRVQDSTTVNFPNGTVVKTDTVWVAQSAYDYLVAQNESKRQIQLIDKKYASVLETELQSLLSS